MSFKNLDFECAKEAQNIVAKLEQDKIRTILSILEAQGLCAMFVYIEKKMKDDVIRKHLTEFLKNIIKTELGDIYCNLDKLLLANNLIRRLLDYALLYSEKKKEDKNVDLL